MSPHIARITPTDSIVVTRGEWQAYQMLKREMKSLGAARGLDGEELREVASSVLAKVKAKERAGRQGR